MDYLFPTLHDLPHQTKMEVSVVAMQKRFKEAFAVAELHKIHALHTHVSRFCIPSGKIAKICAICVMFKFFADFAQFTLMELTQASANSEKFTLYLLIRNNFIIFTPCKAGSSTLSE